MIFCSLSKSKIAKMASGHFKRYRCANVERFHSLQFEKSQFKLHLGHVFCVHSSEDISVFRYAANVSLTVINYSS